MSDTKINLNQIQQNGASTGQFVQFNGTDWLASSSAIDNNFFIVDNSDNTKKAAFQVGSISASTTRTFTFPDVTGILALTTGTGGTNRITYWNDNDTITSSSTLLTNGTNVAINASITTSYLLKLKQTTTGDGIFVERSSDTRGVAMYNDGTATFESVGGGNLLFKSGASTTMTFSTAGGGGQISQLAFIPTASVTSVFSNSNMLNINGTYAPTTSGGSFHGVIIGVNINQTGAADQLTSGLYINPTLTAVVSAGFKGVHYGPSTQTFLYQPSGTSVASHLIGNLGVGTGTTSPSAKIDIVGNGSTSATYGLKVQNSTGTNNALIVRDDGRVGILTTSPNTALEVAGTVRITSSTGTPTAVVGRNASGDISNLTLGAGLTISGGQLNTTGSASAAGTDYNVQYYSAGNLGASSTFTFDPTNIRLGIGISTGMVATLQLRGTVSGSTVFLAENDAGGDLFSIADTGVVKFGGAEKPLLYPVATNTGSVDVTSTGLALDSILDGTSGTSAFSFRHSTNTITSGAFFGINYDQAFSPTSGTATFVMLYLGGTINQTGGANGIIRGIQISPTLTAAADYRALEISNTSGKGLWQTSTTPTNLLGGNTGFGTRTSPTYPIDVGSTGGIRIPVGTTAERPTTATGVLRYNTSLTALEVYSGSTWQSMGTGTVTTSGSPASGEVAYFSGASAITSASNFQFNGSQVGIGGAPNASYSLYTTSAIRSGGALQSSGTGSPTSSLGSSSVRLQNTTPSTGDLYYLGSTDTGTFTLSSGNASTIMTITTGGNIQTTYLLRIGSVSGITPTTVIGRDANGDVGSVGVGTGLALSSGTLSANQQLSINTQTGTTYTLVLSDAGKLVTLSNASAITLTIPLNSSVAYPTGTIIDIAQLGAGQVTVSPTGGVTLGSADSKTKLRVQYSSGTLIKTGTDTWLLVGDIST